MSVNGNEFVVLDARTGQPKAAEIAGLGREQIKKIAARQEMDTVSEAVANEAKKKGVDPLYIPVPEGETIGLGQGCDQVLIICDPKKGNDESKGEGGDIFLRIFNADGGEVEACGNGTRAILLYLHKKDKHSDRRIGTLGGMLLCENTVPITIGGNRQLFHLHTCVKLPLPKFGWQEIPFAKDIGDTSKVKLHKDLPPAFLVNVGNPHAVIFFDRPDELDRLAEKYGADLENHKPLFPQGANVNFAYIQDEKTIDLVTWERGVGVTKSCGTGSVATAIAAYKTKNMSFPIIVSSLGGPATVDQSEDGGFTLDSGLDMKLEFTEISL